MKADLNLFGASGAFLYFGAVAPALLATGITSVFSASADPVEYCIGPLFAPKIKVIDRLIKEGELQLGKNRNRQSI